MTAVVVASVQSVDRTPFALYATVAVAVTVAFVVYCVLASAAWDWCVGRFVAWLDDRETHRREQRAAGQVRHG